MEMLKRQKFATAFSAVCFILMWLFFFFTLAYERLTFITLLVGPFILDARVCALSLFMILYIVALIINRSTRNIVVPICTLGLLFSLTFIGALTA